MPDDKVQRYFTDAGSRIMPVPGGRDFLQAYNCPAVVMIADAIANVGAVPREVSVDAGYYSAQVVDDLHALGVDPYVAPDQVVLW